MFGKFITETYNKVKSKADEVRFHVSVQAIKAKEVLGLVKPSTIDELLILLNYELQQINSAESLIDTYRRWIYNISQSEKTDCVRYYKIQNKNKEYNKNSNYENKENVENLNKENKNNININNNLNLNNKDVVRTRNKNFINDIGKNPIERKRNLNTNNNEDLINIEEDIVEEEVKKDNIEINEIFKNIKNNNSNDINNEYNKNETQNYLMNNIYDDIYGYNFKEIFLKSDVLEKSITLIIEKKNIRLSLINIVEKEDIENSRNTILTMFKYCLIGDEKLHKDILFIILSTDKLFDNNKELFLELLSILKYDYLDTYLTNIRKIISAEVVCLKNKIISYNPHNFQLKKNQFFKDTNSFSNEFLFDYDNIFNDFNLLNVELKDEIEKKDVTEKKDEIEKKENIENEIENMMNEEKKENIEIIEKKKDMENNETIFFSQNYEDFNKEDNKIDFLNSEKEIIENNKIQQIKILASSKLIELHKIVYKILILSIQNRENKKIEMKRRLEELKKIMNVCKKDCDIILNDVEGNNMHLDNVYKKELDLIKNNLNKKKEEIEEMKKYIDDLMKKKNELYKQYEIIVKEINSENKKLANAINSLALHKKELNDTKNNYLNELSNTSKNKHIQQERKLYISNLNTVSDNILTFYQTSEFANTNELIEKSKKIKKPLKQVILQHLNYLKQKLILLNCLLEFYVKNIKILLEKKCEDDDKQNNIENIKQEKKTINDGQLENQLKFKTINDNLNKRENLNVETGVINNIQRNDKKKQLLKYKKCYFKVIDQINKIYLTIYKFYDQNKEEFNQEIDTGKSNNLHIQEEINKIYNNSKQIIKENNEIILNIS